MDLVKTPLFHITDIGNLPAILASGGLLSEPLVAAARQGTRVAIAHNHIKERRTRTLVPICGGRRVIDFVPFYFCPRSPMLFTVNKGNTGRPPGCQETILHLVTSVARATIVGQPWVFSDGNAGADYPNFYGDTAQLANQLNWAAIKERQNWSPVRGQKAAEFLVADRFPWDQIVAVACYKEAVAREVQAILGSVEYPRVLVRPGWYY